MELAIIGGGITGISLANILSEKGLKPTVYEKNNRVGGLIQCDTVEGNLFHKVGGHVFNAKNQAVSNWFWKHFDQEKEFNKAERNAKIFLGGKFIGYPLEDHLYQLEGELAEKIIQDLLSLNKNEYRNPFSYPNFEEFLKGNFGPTLYDLYFEPYNRKIWKTDLKTVPMEWLDGKLPMPNIQKLLIKNILRGQENEMVHSTFFYPKKNGSQFIIDRLSKGVNVLTGKGIVRLERKDSKWLLNGEESYDQIAYTGDVRMLATLLSSTPEIAAYIAGLNLDTLRSNGTSNLFCYTDESDLSWLYLPGAETQAHRIIYTGNFSDQNNASSRKTCVVEFSGQVSEAEMRQQIKSLPGNLDPLAYNFQPSSYVIHDADTRSIINKLKMFLSEFGLHLVGRFAEWEYYNMDKAIEASMDLAERICNKSKV
jgi:protoporphyrinogen oxidase